jgi:hypothetical protein
VLHMLHSFGAWLEMTRFAMFIQNAPWAIPTIQTVHIVCVAALISATFLVDFRILGIFSPSQPLVAVSNRFIPWVWWILLILFVTGSLLLSAEPSRSITNPAFFIKMTLLVTVASLTAVLQTRLTKDAGYWDGDRAGLAKGIAITSLILWSCIVFAGRWIAYVESL